MNENEDLCEEGFWNVLQGAKFLGISRSKMYDLLNSGEVPSASFGASRRIPIIGLREYARRNLKGGREPQGLGLIGITLGNPSKPSDAERAGSVRKRRASE